MNKEEILERSRKENQNQDEREKFVLARAGQIATAIGGLVCAAIILFETIFTEFEIQTTLIAWAVYLSMTGTTLLVKYINLKKNFDLIVGIFQILIAVASFVMYVVKTVG